VFLPFVVDGWGEEESSFVERFLHVCLCGLQISLACVESAEVDLHGKVVFSTVTIGKPMPTMSSSYLWDRLCAADFQSVPPLLSIG